MTELHWFAVTESGPLPLPVPEGAAGFEDLYEELPLGVYSALRTFEHNKFLCLEEHLDRTERSMALLGWEYRLDRERLRHALHQVCTTSPWPDARVRFDVLARPAPQLGTGSRDLIALMPFTPIPPRLYEIGVAVGLAPELSRRRPLAKTADFSLRRRDYQTRRRGGFYENLMLDEAGHILEGTGTNFYGVRDGVVWTAGEGVLEGITRRIILDLLPGLGIPLRLSAVHLSDIPYLDEAAISGSSRALVPVVQIDGRVVGDGRPGPICRRILEAYTAYVKEAIRTAV